MGKGDDDSDPLYCGEFESLPQSYWLGWKLPAVSLDTTVGVFSLYVIRVGLLLMQLTQNPGKLCSLVSSQSQASKTIQPRLNAAPAASNLVDVVSRIIAAPPSFHLRRSNRWSPGPAPLHSTFECLYRPGRRDKSRPWTGAGFDAWQAGWRARPPAPSSWMRQGPQCT